MNSNLHRQLAKQLHMKTSVTLSSFLAASVDDLMFQRAVNIIRDHEVDKQQVATWIIQVSNNGRPTVLGAVHCSYIDACRTALCLEPGMLAYIAKVNGGDSSQVPAARWAAFIAIEEIDLVMATADQIDLSRIEHEGKRSVLFFDEWLQTKRDVKDIARYTNHDADSNSHCTGALYGPRDFVVPIVFDDRTDDHIVRYDHRTFMDNMECTAEALAYKIYLCLCNEISEDQLMAYFDDPRKA